MLGWVFEQTGGQSIEGCRLVLRLIEEMRGHGEDTDGWLPMRVKMNIRLAGLYFSEERREEGYAALEEGIGLAVLYAGLDHANLQMFLLDKTVSINKGVYFFVAPLLTRATVSFATDGM